MRKIILLLLLSYGGIAIAQALNVTVKNQTNRNLSFKTASSHPMGFSVNANTTKKITSGTPIQGVRVLARGAGPAGVGVYPEADKDFEMTITENPDKTLTISGTYGTVTTKPLP